MPLSDYVVTDDLTILLGLNAVALFLLHNLYKPQPLVHPILLGRQSDVARVRNPGESAVYRNYSTGIMGRFPLRPSKDVYTVMDLLRTDSDVTRTLWSTKITNSALRERVQRAAAGFVNVGKFVQEESNVLLLLNDSLEFLITDLALASQAIPTFTLSSPSLLSAVLESHPPSAIVVDAETLPHILEVIYDSREGGHHTVIVVGELDSRKDYAKLAQHVNLIRFVDIEAEANVLPNVPSVGPDTVYTVAFSESPSGGLQAVQLTHQNLTAGVAATRALVPVSNAISNLDTIVSAHSMSTLYGRSIAYTAIFEGTSFTTLNSTKLFSNSSELTTFSAMNDFNTFKSYPIPSPTLLFVNPSHANILANSILDEAKKNSFLYAFGWRHKIAGVTEGFITKESLWDRLVFDNARISVLGEGAGTLRGVLISGADMEATAITPARIAFSVPVVNVESHPLVAAPILASHPLDLQMFSIPDSNDPFDRIAASGPPTVNVEVKLVGVNDDAIESGGNPTGTLCVRGPAVGKLVGVEALEDIAGEEPWLSTGAEARVLTNGTIKVVHPVKK